MNHLLLNCKPQFRPSDAVKVLKGNTARWLFLAHPELKEQLRGGHLWNPSTTGKVYNCDLNASYNIGARYFAREITKSLPARVRQRMEAKVPSCAKRSTCTLSTLISLNAELYAAA